MEVCVLSATMRGVRVEFRLPRDAMCSLGRSSSCTLQVKDPRISRQHCMLCFHGEALEVTDMGSANELQHIGERKSSLRLMSGDSFHAGNTYFRFEAIERTPGDASSVAEPAAPPAESPAEPAAEPPAELPAEPTTWPGEPAIGDVVAGCRLLKLLGRSERCAVFAAEHLTLHRRIALKWLGPHASREQFLADIRKTTSLDLPGLVGVFDVAPDPANCCAWMELVEGASIAVRIAEGPRFLWHEAADLAIALVTEDVKAITRINCIGSDMLTAASSQATCSCWLMARSNLRICATRSDRVLAKIAPFLRRSSSSAASRARMATSTRSPQPPSRRWRADPPRI